MNTHNNIISTDITSFYDHFVVMWPHNLNLEPVIVLHSNHLIMNDNDDNNVSMNDNELTTGWQQQWEIQSLWQWLHREIQRAHSHREKSVMRFSLGITATHSCQVMNASVHLPFAGIMKIRLYRYVTGTNVPFFDPSPNLVVRSKNGTFVRVT